MRLMCRRSNVRRADYVIPMVDLGICGAGEENAIIYWAEVVGGRVRRSATRSRGEIAISSRSCVRAHSLHSSGQCIQSIFSPHLLDIRLARLRTAQDDLHSHLYP